MVFNEVVIMDNVLRIPLISELEERICKFYGTSSWIRLAWDEAGIARCWYDDATRETVITFNDDATKTWFLLRWS